MGLRRGVSGQRLAEEASKVVCDGTPIEIWEEGREAGWPVSFNQAERLGGGVRMRRLRVNFWGLGSALAEGEVWEIGVWVRRARLNLASGNGGGSGNMLWEG
eukprot:3511720-Rhodomonas_salina.3